MATSTHAPEQTLRQPQLLQRYFPGLNGLRAIAFLIVFVHHYSAGVFDSWVTDWGWAGVDLFFVLSGFLITGILYDSLGSPRYFRNFYIRRSLRIFPLFFGFWILLLVLTPILHVQWNWYIASMAGYIGNFFMAGARMGLHAAPGVINITLRRQPAWLMAGHLWSLCVEEQFYLVWPAVIYLVRSRKALLWICLSLMLTVPFLRALYIHLSPEGFAAGALNFNSFSHLDTLLFGSAIALWLRSQSISPSLVRRVATVATIGAPLLLIACWCSDHAHYSSPQASPMVATLGYTLIAIASSGILLMAIDPALPFARLLSWKPLAEFGAITYGLYFYHYIPSPLISGRVKMLAPHHLAFFVPLGAFIFSVAAAWLSFHYYEQPFIALKNRFAPSEHEHPRRSTIMQESHPSGV
jgi:peptidoglycan/LPS O-acetylase OafA/YrhL